MFICSCHNQSFKSQKALSGHLGQIKSRSLRLKKNYERWQKIHENYSLNPSKCKQCKTNLVYNCRNRKFCSLSCSAKYNNIIRPNKESKYYRTKKINKCLNCDRPCKGVKFCSHKCSNLYKHQQTKNQFEQGLISNRQRLRKYLITIIGHKCQQCDNDIWLNLPIPLELNHIDGNATNNFPNNLEIICPNCHALTPTYKAKNKGNGRKSRGLKSC